MLLVPYPSDTPYVPLAWRNRLLTTKEQVKLAASTKVVRMSDFDEEPTQFAVVCEHYNSEAAKESDVPR